MAERQSNSFNKEDNCPVLCQLIGPEPGKRYKIDKSLVTIGRDEERDIQFEDRTMSRMHCEILFHKTHPRSLIIRDAGSHNGIMVNGRKTMEQELKDEDQIDVGDIRFIISIPKESEVTK